MLTKGAGIFIHFPHETGPRILRPATVIDRSADGCLIGLENEGPVPAPDEEIVLYHNIRSDFMRQSARVTAVHREAPRPLFAIEVVGKPISAESRQWFRVPTLASGLIIKVGAEDECPLINVSQTGLSFMSRHTYCIGDSLPVSLSFQGETWTGRACVQRFQSLPSGFTRYGLQCDHEAPEANELARGLRTVTLAVQRMQLRHIAGAG